MGGAKQSELKPIETKRRRPIRGLLRFVFIDSVSMPFFLVSLSTW